MHSLMSLIVASSLLVIASAQYVLPPAPVGPGPACSPSCVGGAACYAGACQCAQPAVVYSPVVGCAPPPPPPPPPMLPVPMMPAPVVVGRLIPQALPGSPCEPGVECTGGSVCSLGICLCPPELVQEGTVCVTRTIYVAPPPPPPILMPMPVAQIPLGAPCYAAVAAAPPCVPGALCSAGVCQCSPAYHPTPGGCVLRK